jgi:hypothetical protein
MANSIKKSGAGGLALQVTRPAREAELVEENSEGDARYLADVRVFSFDHLLLVVDVDKIESAHTADLVASAARDTDSVYRARDASIQIAGHGYQIHLPTAEDAGFRNGDSAPCHPARNMLAISKEDGTSAGADATRLARDLATLRSQQVE